MKVNKTLEKEIQTVMEDYWNSYFVGDLQRWASFLPDHYHNIGTTKEEIWNSKKEIWDYTVRVTDQMVGMADMRNKKIQIIPYDPYIMVHELGDLYVKADEGWVFYALLRLSSLLEKTSDGWKILHQHGSYPDAKADEGETFGFDELKAENKKLRDAIHSRTIELERKNRDLEIEAALERVRTVAMTMTQPDDLLNICEALFKELSSFGWDSLRNAILHVFDDDHQQFTDYDYSGTAGGTIGRIPYSGNPVVENFIEKIRKSEDSFFEVEVSGKDLASWKAFRKSTNMQTDPRLEKAEALYYYIYSVGAASIGISSFRSISPEQLDLLKRFRNVFHLAYRRYGDIRKAEAQAREASIEAALERVRAIAMSMRTPEELQAVGDVIFKELKSLGFANLRNTEIIINQDEKQSILSYYYSDYGVSGQIEVNYTSHPVLKKWAEELKTAGDGFATVHISESEMADWKRYREELGYQPDPKLDKAKTLDYYSYSTGLGALSISSFTPISEEQLAKLERFRNVFGLAYRRYMDVAQAEAQAREAQIEAAMERVRAKAMAMQTPEELVEVAELLRREMGSLGVEELETSSIYIHDQTTGKTECWFSIQNREQEENLVSDHMMMDLNGTWVGQEMLQFYRSDEEKTSIVMQGANRSEWINYCAENSELFTVEGFYGEKIPERTYHLYKFNSGFMGAAAPGDISAESWDLLKRATSVFSLAYTRFVDLKNAEAQAREAKIETALERVRARTMGMQQSTELKEVIQVLFDQFGYLDIFVQHTGFILDYKDRDDMLIWLADQHAVIPQISFPYFDSPHWNSFLKAKKSGINLFVNQLDFDQKNDFYEKLFSHLPEIPEEIQEFYFQCPALAISTVLLDNVGLYIENYSGIPYTDEENEILLRFGKVFQQSYTRFLDLKKAEAQAREARIEAALEKVRSRSLAMHKSEELADLSLELVKQVQALGVETWFCAFNIYDDHPDGSLEWGSNGQGTFPRYRTPREGIFKYYYDAGQRGESLLVHEINENECPAHYEYLCSLPGVGEQLLKMKAAGLSFPTHQIDHVAYFKYGYIIYITFEEVPEAHDIFKRFARVFEQSYTRFLDLQKAEAQTREAENEAALERVRSRTMAMHSSDELLEVGAMLFRELSRLGIENMTSGYVLMDEEKKVGWNYGVNPGEGTVRPLPTGVPQTGTAVLESITESWKKQEPLLVIELDPEETIEHQSYIAENCLNFSLTKEQLLARSPERLGIHTFNFKHGYLLLVGGSVLAPEQQETAVRFAKVFEMTYRRFLDIKNTEAQAREAQIEMALERARNQSMLMQSSEELNKVSNVFHEQLLLLGLPTELSYVWLPDEDTQTHLFWATWSEKNNGKLTSRSKAVTSPLDKSEPYTAACYEMWESDQSVFVNQIKPEEVEDFFTSWSDLVGEAENMKAELFPDGLYYAEAYMKYGCFGINIRRALTEEEQQVLGRFSVEFERAYTRFLDLKKAEAQAREAQIEAALERVRARTMAMHHPDELQEVVALVAEKLQDLGVILDANGVILCTYFENSRDVMHWISAPDFSGSGRYLLPYFDHPIFSAAWESKLSGDDYFSRSFTVEEKNSFFEYAFEHSDYRHFPEDFKEWVFQNDKHSLSFAWSENSAILIPSHTGVVPSGSDQEILKRFAAVFEQAYVRFRDLQVKEEQATRIEEEKKRLEKTLAHLQATQAQLIQSEKMASLGELTAGIAHEIQNPLNFVNNFSEVSSELIEEMKEEMDNGDLEEVRAIAEDIQQNLEKINHHGRRADAIVKGMLEHSRKSSGEKVPTDINKLADEYMRLAYHGLRAKDKSFNATLHTDFDPAIGKIPVIPQDIGRVLLNLFTNAFYAVSEKKKSNGQVYEPTVTVSTSSSDDHITIAVQDNGNGIPQSVLDKIFQPFFTTKPTGQGTGLGLSLSYDIIKAHEGRLEVETEQGDHTIFKIILPKK